MEKNCGFANQKGPRLWESDMVNPEYLEEVFLTFLQVERSSSSSGGGGGSSISSSSKVILNL